MYLEALVFLRYVSVKRLSVISRNLLRNRCGILQFSFEYLPMEVKTSETNFGWNKHLLLLLFFFYEILDR